MLSVRVDNSRRDQCEAILVRQYHVTNMIQTSLHLIKKLWYNIIICSLIRQSRFSGRVVYESTDAQCAVLSICMLSSSTLTF